jgi:hypothetical protein
MLIKINPNSIEVMNLPEYFYWPKICFDFLKRLKRNPSLHPMITKPERGRN